MLCVCGGSGGWGCCGYAVIIIIITIIIVTLYLQYPGTQAQAKCCGSFVSERKNAHYDSVLEYYYSQTKLGTRRDSVISITFFLMRVTDIIQKKLFILAIAHSKRGWYIYTKKEALSVLPYEKKPRDREWEGE